MALGRQTTAATAYAGVAGIHTVTRTPQRRPEATAEIHLEVAGTETSMDHRRAETLTASVGLRGLGARAAGVPSTTSTGKKGCGTVRGNSTSVEEVCVSYTRRLELVQDDALFDTHGLIVNSV